MAQLYCNGWQDIADCLTLQGVGFLKIGKVLETFYKVKYLLIHHFVI